MKTVVAAVRMELEARGRGCEQVPEDEIHTCRTAPIETIAQWCDSCVMGYAAQFLPRGNECG